VGAVLSARSDIRPSAGMTDDEIEKYHASQLSNQLKMLSGCIEQLETEIVLKSASAEDAPVATPASPLSSTRVFVVHGHDQGSKEATARFLEKLGLDPIILHDKPNAGRTIIEKFSDYSNVSFAIVLLTADDEGKARDDTASPRPRARQNVILELGYFLGKLGRAQVCALYEEGVEIPSDYDGVVFIPLVPEDKWKFGLVRELKAAGFNVDANKVFSAD